MCVCVCARCSAMLVKASLSLGAQLAAIVPPLYCSLCIRVLFFSLQKMKTIATYHTPNYLWGVRYKCMLNNEPYSSSGLDLAMRDYIILGLQSRLHCSLSLAVEIWPCMSLPISFLGSSCNR